MVALTHTNLNSHTMSTTYSPFGEDHPSTQQPNYEQDQYDESELTAVDPEKLPEYNEEELRKQIEQDAPLVATIFPDLHNSNLISHIATAPSTSSLTTTVTENVFSLSPVLSPGAISSQSQFHSPLTIPTTSGKSNPAAVPTACASSQEKPTPDVSNTYTVHEPKILTPASPPSPNIHTSSNSSVSSPSMDLPVLTYSEASIGNKVQHNLLSSADDTCCCHAKVNSDEGSDPVPAILLRFDDELYTLFDYSLVDGVRGGHYKEPLLAGANHLYYGELRDFMAALWYQFMDQTDESREIVLDFPELNLVIAQDSVDAGSISLQEIDQLYVHLLRSGHLPYANGPLKIVLKDRNNFTARLKKLTGLLDPRSLDFNSPTAIAAIFGDSPSRSSVNDLMDPIGVGLATVVVNRNDLPSPAPSTSSSCAGLYGKMVSEDELISYEEAVGEEMRIVEPQQVMLVNGTRRKIEECTEDDSDIETNTRKKCRPFE
ncbi:hypothetical protein BC936DRAFT_138074 [Jimgerdemannia flammicorona]|uniref:Uncharacterized protein n=1 Tax=Jimgerdemannia flammicorona TaxID=994334 RepID=A0A433DMU0_9FUNG|nr:hypothetical protein BC936DRAFT_138074 [Jimgerdemannia flammicorona]